MSSSLPDTAATNCDVDSYKSRSKFTHAGEGEDTAYNIDNLLLEGRISHADVRSDYGMSGLHWIAYIGRDNKGVDTDILLSYLLTCDPPADINGRNSWGRTPMWEAAYSNNTSAVKVLIDFGGDRTIKTNSDDIYNPNRTPLDIAKKFNINKENIKLLTECFPSEE